MTRCRRSGRRAPAAVALAAALVLSGCGSQDQPEPQGDAATPSEATSTASASESPTGSASPSKAAEPQGTVVAITFEGDRVDPDGVERRAEVGEPITLRITADAPGELHVHSEPEQEISYPAGTSVRKLVVDKPGLVDVESHDLDQLIVKLEVR